MRPSLVLTFLLSTLLISGEAAAGKSTFTASSTIVYSGATYSYSSSSTCPNGTAALRYERKWWCPAVSTSTSTSSTSTTITAPATYNASLSWTIPTTRADGTPLTASELAGYEIYYTTDTGSVSAVVPVTGGSANSTTVSSLKSGNYSFSISAVDTNGLKSALSTVTTINFP